MLLWLRSETKPFERRAALAPKDAAELRQAGVEVVVERCRQRIFADADYAAAGARLVETGAWTSAPPDAVILGLKELPEGTGPLRHRHVYFAHAYKNQRGADSLLRRFSAGGGLLLDLEYLVGDDGRRVAAFGRWAGFAGAAVGLDLWAHQQVSQDKYPGLSSFDSRDALLAWLMPRLETAFARANRQPSVLLFGAKGRCGAGALDMLSRANLDRVLGWDKDETAAGGPFDEALSHDLLVNCVLLSGPTKPFLVSTMLDRPRRLSVISDVSCDPYSPHNPLPVYSETTTFETPALRLREAPRLDLTAIDHLPSLLPRESSEDFSSQLAPHLKTLDAGTSVWTRAARLFNEKARPGIEAARR